MKKCPDCGTEAKDSAKFCPKCGFSFSEADPAHKERICPDCGTVVQDNAAFCPNCGSKLQEADKASGALQNIPGNAQDGKPDVFCPNCGERVPYGTGFCPNCGATVQGKPKKKHKPLIAAIAVIAAAALVCAGAMAFTRLFMPADKKFLKYHKDMLSGRMLTSVEQAVNSFDKGGISSDLTVTASTDSGIINGFLNNSKLLLKLEADGDELTANGELNIAGTKLLSASAFYEDGEAGVCVPELDKNQYVCDLEEMLGYNTDIPDISGEELREVIEPYLEVLFTSVNKENVSVEKSEDFELETGGTYKGDIYIFQPRAEDVTKTINEFAGQLEKDDGLREFLHELATPALLSELGMENANEIDGAIGDAANELREYATEAGRSFVDSGFKWRLYVKGDSVHRIDIGLNEYPDFLVFEDTGEKNGTRSMQLRFNDGYDNYAIANSYEKENGRYSGTVSLTGEGESISIHYITENKNTSTLGIPYGTYDFIVTGAENAVTLDVKEGGSEGDLHRLNISGLASASDGMINNLTVSINATEKGTAKRVDGPEVDITHYTDRELENLAESLGEAFYKNIASQLGPLFN